jgi:uncharacterized protein (UPF0303 family)
MACKFGGVDRSFADYYGLGTSERGKYAIEGGGYPIFVKGVEGVVGAIVVAGLDGDQAHQIVVKAMEEYKDLRDGFRSPMRNISTALK